MTIPQFPEMLAAIDAAGVVIDPDGGTEPNGNLCSISLSREQADILTVNEVIEFVQNAAALFDAKRHSVAPEQRMVFYCWVDEMAGQLRFSVVSSEPLPFGCTVRIVSELSTIANQLLSCQQLDGLSFEQFKPETASVDDEESESVDEPFVLDVFVLNLPQDVSFSRQFS